MSGEVRLSAFPSVPTFTEGGVPGISLNIWQGVGVPTGTPRAVIERMSAEIGKLLALPETKEKLDSQGFEPFYNNPEQSAAIIKDELAKYARIIREANIKPL